MRWRFKSPASRLFTQPFVQAQIKENTKAPRQRWPLNFPHKRPVTRWGNAEMFPFDDVIMRRGFGFSQDYFATQEPVSPRVYEQGWLVFNDYRQTSNISRTKTQNLNVFRLVLQLSLPNALKQAMLQLHMIDQQSYRLPWCVLVSIKCLSIYQENHHHHHHHHHYHMVTMIIVVISEIWNDLLWYYLNQYMLIFWPPNDNFHDVSCLKKMSFWMLLPRIAMRVRASMG